MKWILEYVPLIICGAVCLYWILYFFLFRLVIWSNEHRENYIYHLEFMVPKGDVGLYRREFAHWSIYDEAGNFKEAKRQSVKQEFLFVIYKRNWLYIPKPIWDKIKLKP